MPKTSRSRSKTLVARRKSSKSGHDGSRRLRSPASNSVRWLSRKRPFDDQPDPQRDHQQRPEDVRPDPLHQAQASQQGVTADQDQDDPPEPRPMASPIGALSLVPPFRPFLARSFGWRGRGRPLRWLAAHARMLAPGLEAQRRRGGPIPNTWVVPSNVARAGPAGPPNCWRPASSSPARRRYP